MVGERSQQVPEKTVLADNASMMADDADDADDEIPTFSGGGSPRSETLDPDEWNKIKHAF